MNTMQSHGTGVLDMIRSLSEFDILAIQQYSDQTNTMIRICSLTNWIAIVTGLVAAVFWFCSALVRLPPGQIETMENDPKSLPAILKQQSSLSAVAAILTAVSVFAQAVFALLHCAAA